VGFLNIWYKFPTAILASSYIDWHFLLLHLPEFSSEQTFERDDEIISSYKEGVIKHLVKAP